MPLNPFKTSFLVELLLLNQGGRVTHPHLCSAQAGWKLLIESSESKRQQVSVQKSSNLEIMVLNITEAVFHVTSSPKYGKQTNTALTNKNHRALTHQ